MVTRRSATLAVLAAFVLVLSVGVVARAAPNVPDPKQSVRCEPGSVTTPASNTVQCEINQTPTSGNNNALCEMTSDATPIVLICKVTQSTVGGDNHAKVRLRTHQKKSPTENVTQRATVKQTTTGSGSNFLDIDEDAKQQIEPPDGSTQNQTARQFADVTQKSDTGRNEINLDQSQKQHAESNVVAFQHQISKTTDHITQNSQGISKAFAHLDEDQRLQAKPGSTQIQDPDDFCCAIQQTNAADSFQITETANQIAKPTAATQTDSLVGTCNSSGRCQVALSLTTNSGTQTQSCSSQGTGCTRSIVIGFIE